MTNSHLQQAMEIARSDKELQHTSIFDGFGLAGFQQVTVTLEALAWLIRWQCFQMDGGIDQDALNEIATLGKHRFLIA